MSYNCVFHSNSLPKVPKVNIETEEQVLRQNYNVHDHLKHLSVAELQQTYKEAALPYAICAINIDSSLNMGTMIRSACLLGAERFLVFGKTSYDKRACVGAQNYIPIERLEGRLPNGELDINIFNDLLAKYDYVPCFVEQGGRPITDLHQVKLARPQKPCLVLGSEGLGIPKHFYENSPYVFSVPQVGILRSFNVSAAAAIALWQASQAWG